MKERLARFVTMVKLQHALFALPFTLASMFMAQKGMVSLEKFFWIVIAFMSARTLGMGMNRLVDRKIDAKNPRTAHRMMASGRLSVLEVVPLLMLSSAILAYSAWQLDPLCLKLLPVCLFFLLIYPYTKRFTFLAHTFLGVVLALGPIGSWAAIQGELSWTPLCLGLSILLWVNGFDVIYAVQDEEFDRENGLHSIPVLLGKKNALLFSRLVHAFVPVFWVATGVLEAYSGLYFFGTAILSSLLIWEHVAVAKGYKGNLALAFFKLNSTISVGYFFIILLEIFL